MRSITSRLAGAFAGVSLFLSSATGALAQYDYEYTYDTTDDAAAAAASGVFGAFWLIWCCCVLFGLVLFAFRIWMLIHAIKNAPEDQKTLWIILVLLVPFADWVYFFTKKKEWSSPKVEASQTA